MHARQKPLTVPAAAALCQVGRRSMFRWVEDGLLPSHRTGGGHYRIEPADLRAFMQDRGMPVPASLGGGAPRLLLVDDDVGFVTAFRRLLAIRLPEADIRVAHDGFAAGVVVASHRPHLVFLDLQMPGTDGEQVCRAIRADRSLDGVAIAFLTGFPERLRWDRLLELGADHLLSKPVDDDALDAVLARHLPARAHL